MRSRPTPNLCEGPRRTLEPHGTITARKSKSPSQNARGFLMPRKGVRMTHPEFHGRGRRLSQERGMLAPAP